MLYSSFHFLFHYPYITRIFYITEATYLSKGSARKHGAQQLLCLRLLCRAGAGAGQVVARDEASLAFRSSGYKAHSLNS